MKINLYVDDLRDCPNGFVVARTYDEALTILAQNEILEDEQGNELKYFCENGLMVQGISSYG